MRGVTKSDDLRRYLMARMGLGITCFPFQDYLRIDVLTLAANLAGSIISSVQFGYGTFRFNAMIANPDAQATIFPFLLEGTHGTPNDIIYLRNIGAAYVFGSAAGGAGGGGAIAGQDWTVEREFRIDWSAGLAVLYVDDVLVSTIAANVPIPPLAFGIEIITAAAPAVQSQTWIRRIRFPSFTPRGGW